jgi:hypothetical protein
MVTNGVDEVFGIGEPYQIIYQTNVTFMMDVATIPSTSELDETLASAFTESSSLGQYLLLIQSLPDTNLFSTTTTIGFTDTVSSVDQSRSISDESSFLISVAVSAGFMALVLSCATVMLYRHSVGQWRFRCRNRKLQGKGNMVHSSDDQMHEDNDQVTENADSCVGSDSEMNPIESNDAVTGRERVTFSMSRNTVQRYLVDDHETNERQNKLSLLKREKTFAPSVSLSSSVRERSHLDTALLAPSTADGHSLLILDDNPTAALESDDIFSDQQQQQQQQQKLRRSRTTKLSQEQHESESSVQRMIRLFSSSTSSVSSTQY